MWEVRTSQGEVVNRFRYPGEAVNLILSLERVNLNTRYEVVVVNDD